MKKNYLNILIWLLSMFFYSYFLINNINCDNNNINSLFITNNTLINQIQDIDELFFENSSNLIGELFTIDINSNLLKINSKQAELTILKKILLIEERKFELFLFTSFEDLKSYDSILNTIKVTSKIKKVKIGHSGVIDFAELGTCTLLDKNNNLINATFLLIKHTGSSKELYDICKENILFNNEIFRKNIIQKSIPRKLDLRIYSILPINNLIEIYNKLQILVKRNYGLGFCIIYNNHLEGFIMEAYDITSEIQWYLRIINLKYIKFTIKMNEDINKYLNLPDIKKNINKYLYFFLENSKNNKFIPILDKKISNQSWNDYTQDYKFNTVKNKNKNKTLIFKKFK